MLLRLLDTETRVAYARSNEPIPFLEKWKFICGSVNLTSCNISAMSFRIPRSSDNEVEVWAATTFSDYLNYSLALNLVENIIYLGNEQENDKSLKSILNVNLARKTQEKLVSKLENDKSWYGVFADCENIFELRDVMQDRLDQYRAYFNFNVENISESIVSTRTEIGEPIYSLSEYLRDSGIIPNECLIYLKIDQHEELYDLERETGLGDIFRQVINKALAGRDRRSAYRIGTRHYSWSDNLKIWGTSSSLEQMRAYSVIDIDDILKHHENPRMGNKLFRSFSADVFKRRLAVAGFSVQYDAEDLVKEIFGPTPTVRQRALEFATPIRKHKILYPETWAPAWCKLFTELREKDPIEAKFGEAWLRQKKQIAEGVSSNGNIAGTNHWSKRQWWKKERSEVALMQLAAETGQNLSWYGERHIYALSGGNILVFMSICRTIWSGWLRRQSTDSLKDLVLPKISSPEQKIGIYEASKLWVEKLREGLDGSQRDELIRSLGEWFERTLKNDDALSNPGHNGFSLKQSEMNCNDSLVQLIKRCKDNGDLYESAHTPKNKTGKRIKWYLNPIFCPYFSLPHVRTKEPIYVSLKQLYSIVFEARTLLQTKENTTSDLFEES